MKEKKKNLLKYAGEISSPVIKQDDIKKWESDAVKSVNDHFAQKFNEIKNEYSKLIDEFKCNDLVYKSNYSFKPIQGKTYHLYQKDDEKKSYSFFWLSKETSILINNWFMMYFLSVVLIGTVYPIFLEAFTNEKISVGEPFYQKLITPFMVPFLIFMAFAPNISWIKQKAKIFNIKILILFLLNLILAFYIVRLTDTKYLFSTILITSALFLFLISLKDFINSNSLISQRISHLAFSILILSILFNGILAKEYNSNMGVGDEVKFFNGTIKFLKISINKENNYQNIKGTFEYKNLQNKDILFEPEIRVYDQPNISTSEADIKTNFFTDNILNFNLLKDEEYFSVRYQYKPLMFWVWISTFFLAFGGVLSFFRK